MGCGGSKAAAVDERDNGADAASKELDRQMAEQQKEEAQVTKLLVLGTGESGKSTIFKQMKILYAVPDPPSKYIPVCRANLIGNAHMVHGGMEILGIEFATPVGKAASDAIKSVAADGNAECTAEMVQHFADMYADKGVDEAIERAAEYQLNDSTRYFFERAADILSAAYQPTEQDSLRARVRTTGIVQQHFEIKERKYTMFDVGGQRNERRKWIHCFDNVTACIFVTAISEFDQKLYEDASTNRMDEAVTLYDQICNHPSFGRTSMILFLNKRDLFAAKLAKVKSMDKWTQHSKHFSAEKKSQLARLGSDYDKCIQATKEVFIDLNKDAANRQVYCHATCATDTSNISFVMSAVFDVILKENLRKMQRADLGKILDVATGTGQSSVRLGAEVWQPASTGKVILCAAFYTDNLKERKVLVDANNPAQLPGVEVQLGSLTEEDFMWVLELGRAIPTLKAVPSELGSFRGNFKEAVGKLRALLGLKEGEDLGFVYDKPIGPLKDSRHTLLVCVKLCDLSVRDEPYGLGFKGAWVEHEAFENPHYKAYCGVDTVAVPVHPPKKGEEFDPFAPNPVGFRWFKGVTLFTAAVSKVPDKGVYLAVFKVCSTPTGFKIMVNEHNRIMIPIIFLTETQLEPAEVKWMHGVRMRESFGIDVLEGAKPNAGWLGPEMSGEDGATFKEKLHWAIGEAKARFGIDPTKPLGAYYDRELLQVDERNNMQILLYGSLATGDDDILPGHSWVEREALEVQNMKYYCPTMLQASLQEQQKLIESYHGLDDGTLKAPEEIARLRKDRDAIKDKLDQAIEQQSPLKWVNRVIMWCADKMPSFGEAFLSDDAPTTPAGEKAAAAAAAIEKAIAHNTMTDASNDRRKVLIKKYVH